MEVSKEVVSNFTGHLIVVLLLFYLILFHIRAAQIPKISGEHTVSSMSGEDICLAHWFVLKGGRGKPAVPKLISKQKCSEPLL